MNDDELTFDFREQLAFELSSMQNYMTESAAFYRDSLDLYKDVMQNAIRLNHPYFDDDELFSLHENSKTTSVEEV